VCITMLNTTFTFIILCLPLFIWVALGLPVTTTSADVCTDSPLPLANGTQNPIGSCSNTVMGEIPNQNNMVASRITSPRNSQCIVSNTAFDIDVKVIHFSTGNFDDSSTQYYTYPQTLDESTGYIQGHSHVTVQLLGGQDDVPDPTIFAFFKGLNSVAINGVLSTSVDKGLPKGNYRICTMATSYAHQPVLMPIAQRGAQDDCIHIHVKDKCRRRTTTTSYPK